MKSFTLCPRKACISCGEVMDAIYSHKIRDTCHECGGRSKVDYDDQKDDIENKEMSLSKIREEKSRRLALKRE